MDVLPGGYHVNAATWFYLSLLLVVAVFFRFGRIWSLRNLDLVLLLCISPGLLMVEEKMPYGYVWLFSVTGLLLLRLFCDGWFQRRPRMEQNLNSPGLAFLCVAAFAFLTAQVITNTLPSSTVKMVDRAEELLKGKAVLNVDSTEASADEADAQPGPAASVLAAVVLKVAQFAIVDDGTGSRNAVAFADWAGRISAIVAHLAVILALIVLAHRHFGDYRLGLAMATLYLLMPCTSYDVGKVNHVLPAAFIVCAVVAYRHPFLSGGLMGLSCGTLFFPVFLLPLWIRFYGRRGALKFGSALVVVVAFLLGSLALTAENTKSFRYQISSFVDWNALTIEGDEEGGFWNGANSQYRIPVHAAFLVMLCWLTIWPRRQNLEHLMAHCTAIVVGIQFWYPRHGGEFILWYLPLLLMVIFRPRLTQLLPPEPPARGK